MQKPVHHSKTNKVDECGVNVFDQRFGSKNREVNLSVVVWSAI